MCTGRLDLSYVLRAFSKGADGVFIVGCHLNECNYITHGNFHALSMAYLAKRLMKHIGMDPERLRIQFMSGGEGNLFAEVMSEFGKQVREIGPLGVKEEIDMDALKARLSAVMDMVPYIRLVERERLRIPVNSKEAYEKFFTSEEFEKLFNTLIVEKLAMNQIMHLLKKEPLSTGKIAEAVGLTPSEVSRHMNTSSRHGLVRYDTEAKCYTLA